MASFCRWTLSVDAFASALKSVLPRIFAQYADSEPAAEAEDAFIVPDWACSTCPACGCSHNETLFVSPPPPLRLRSNLQARGVQGNLGKAAPRAAAHSAVACAVVAAAVCSESRCEWASQAKSLTLVGGHWRWHRLYKRYRYHETPATPMQPKFTGRAKATRDAPDEEGALIGHDYDLMCTSQLGICRGDMRRVDGALPDFADVEKAVNFFAGQGEHRSIFVIFVIFVMYNILASFV